MRAFGSPLPIPPPDGRSTAPDGTALPGPVSYQADPQALFATESVAQALRQLEVYGHDGLPALSADDHQIPGWVTAPDVLAAIARQIPTPQLQTAQPQVAAHGGHDGPGTRPPTPLPGYQFTEITVTAGVTRRRTETRRRHLAGRQHPGISPSRPPAPPAPPGNRPGPRRPRRPALRGTRRLTRTPSRRPQHHPAGQRQEQ